ncbi:EAL domain-containing protein [Pseudomonas sp. Lb2C1-1]|uniref:putative bifunctional diguanylate cyclase/phosphodiesterase n=1 Tax=Pseudomonas TaxID=286 RepID=UPI003919E154
MKSVTSDSRELPVHEFKFGEYFFSKEKREQECLQTMTLLHEFDTAINRGELKVYLQPQVALADNKVIGAEALIRWLHPRFGLLTPGDFLPATEKYRKITTLSLWMLRECMLLSRAQAQSQKIRISINLSMQDLESVSFPEQVDALLKQTGAQARDFCMEITETSAMRNPEQCLESMLRLRQAGFTLSIDDFGTGYSSLSHLSKMPVSELKIDRSFIAQLHDAKQREIVKAIVQLGLTLKLRLVAEGVETPSAYDFLRRLGCHEVQGYLIAKPMPVIDFFIWLDSCDGVWQDVPPNHSNTIDGLER